MMPTAREGLLVVLRLAGGEGCRRWKFTVGGGLLVVVSLGEDFS